MTRVPFTAFLPFLKAQVKAPILSLPMETAQFKGSLFGEATPEHLSQGANVVFMLIKMHSIFAQWLRVLASGRSGALPKAYYS